VHALAAQLSWALMLQLVTLLQKQAQIPGHQHAGLNA
jgi:hypothetical protein